MTEPPNPHELSPAARARRDAMLPALLAEVDRTRRARSARRAALTATTVVALIATIAVLTLRAPQNPPLPQPIAQLPPAPRYQIITTRPTSTIQFITSRPIASLPCVEILDDTRLLQTLADAGRPTGLITIDGITRTTRDITDPVTGG